MATPNWYNYQELISEHFNSLGVTAKTNVTLTGVRTKHNIDILVTSKFLGQDIKWIVEAKDWATKIPKHHVQALKSIVNEVGADKGFIVSQVGFQKGALEASENSNITLLTFQQLLTATTNVIETKILDTYRERINLVSTRYWAHSKSIRIQYGLRPERGDFNPDYSTQFLISAIEKALNCAYKQEYPINLKTALLDRFGEESATNYNELINWLNIHFNVIERRILEAEILMQKDKVFAPKITMYGN